MRNYGDTIPSTIPGLRNVTIKQPVGVVGVITPWNVSLGSGIAEKGSSGRGMLWLIECFLGWPIVPFGHDHQKDCPGVSIALFVRRSRYDSKLMFHLEIRSRSWLSLAAGCTCVIKVPEETPFSGLALMEVSPGQNSSQRHDPLTL